MALPGDPPGELEVVDGMPEGGKIQQLDGRSVGLHSGLRAGGNVRDRHEALRKVSLTMLAGPAYDIDAGLAS